jgi:hypothetical protein
MLAIPSNFKEAEFLGRFGKTLFEAARAEGIELYDFGGKNYIVISPQEMQFNEKNFDTYILAIERKSNVNSL